MSDRHEAVRLFLEDLQHDLTEVQESELERFKEMWYENRDRLSFEVGECHGEIDVKCTVDSPEKAHLVAVAIHKILVQVQ